MSPTNVYTLMVNFTTGGFYLAFLFPLVGSWSSSCVARGGPARSRSAGLPCPCRRGGDPLGPVRVPQHLVAAARLPAALPRLVGLVVIAVLGVVGVAIFVSVRPRILDARLIEDEELQDELSDLAGGPR